MNGESCPETCAKCSAPSEGVLCRSCQEQAWVGIVAKTTVYEIDALAIGDIVDKLRSEPNEFFGFLSKTHSLRVSDVLTRSNALTTNVQDELADIVISAFTASCFLNIDLVAAIAAKLNKIRERS